MSLYPRKDSKYLWIKFTVNGKRVQESTGTADRQKAQEYHDKRKAQLWDETRLGVKPSYTWPQAVMRWVAETRHKASHEGDKIILRWLDQYLGGVELGAIDRDMIDRIRDGRLAEGMSNATVNRTLEVVRAILRRAVLEWEWLDRHPKVRLLPVVKRRAPFLTREQAKRLIDELPEHLAAMVKFSLETGLRKSNVTGLEWSQVDLETRKAWIHPDQAKARKAIPVPLSDVAMSVLREQEGKHERYVFTYRGQPVSQVNTKAWHAALARAGIESFRWHDLRHTWASWHAQVGTPMHVLQELGGWQTPDMVRRYAHLNVEHLAVYADRMSQERRLEDDLSPQVATNRLRREESGQAEEL